MLQEAQLAVWLDLVNHLLQHLKRHFPPPSQVSLIVQNWPVAITESVVVLVVVLDVLVVVLVVVLVLGVSSTSPRNTDIMLGARVRQNLVKTLK